MSNYKKNNRIFNQIGEINNSVFEEIKDLICKIQRENPEISEVQIRLPIKPYVPKNSIPFYITLNP